MALMIVELGRRIEDEVRQHFPAEEPVSVLSMTGGVPLAERARDLARQFYTRMLELKQAGGTIHLVLSGPVALSFIFGMLVGLNHFRVQVYHYDPGKEQPYIPVEMPTHDWLA